MSLTTVELSISYKQVLALKISRLLNVDRKVLNLGQRRVVKIKY